jgi:hypothetical protein
MPALSVRSRHRISATAVIAALGFNPSPHIGNPLEHARNWVGTHAHMLMHDSTIEGSVSCRMLAAGQMGMKS